MDLILFKFTMKWVEGTYCNPEYLKQDLSNKVVIITGINNHLIDLFV